MIRLTSLLVALCGCSATPLPSHPAPTRGAHAQVFRLPGDPRVGVYQSIPHGFTTSSYWIEGPEGLIVVDTQFLPSAAAEMVDRAEAITGKPVKLAVVLHPNPDKFNGVATLQARGIEVVTAAQVAALIPAVHTQRHGRFYEDHKPDYPDEVPAPGVFGDATTALSAGGVTVKAHVLPGPGCSAAHVAVEFDGHLFVGDLVANGHHAWLEIGAARAWLSRLSELEALAPRHVHPGRGAPGGPELLAAQREYIRFVLDRIGALRAAGRVDRAAVDAAISEIKARYPRHGYPYFLEIGVPAVWRAEAARAPAGKPPPTGGP